MKIGTRGSLLALWQARTVARLIEERGGPRCEIVIIRTSGDEAPDAPDARLPTPDVRLPTSDRLVHHRSRIVEASEGGRHPTPDLNVKRLFVKEIEEALLDGRVDLAVHSAKDLPVALPDGLRIGAVLPREDPRDALVLPGSATVTGLEELGERLGPRPTIGTSSVRRAAQLAAVFPGARFVPIRGNVDTRLRKLDAGECDAIVLACAGLKRLGLAARISFALPVVLSLPAPGQGTVVSEVRQDAGDLAAAVGAINDHEAMDALIAERAVVETLGGGCQMPLGAFAEIDGTELAVFGIVISPDGRRAIRDQSQGPRSDAAAVGDALARSLLHRGAGEILEHLRSEDSR